MIKEIIMASVISLAPIEFSSKIELEPIRLETSAFCPCYSCSEGWELRTASGVTLSQSKKHIAMPKEYPFGTKLNVPNEGTYVNVDRGGYIKKVNGVTRIDVFMDSHSEALEYGRNTVWGYIVKKKDQ